MPTDSSKRKVWMIYKLLHSATHISMHTQVQLPKDLRKQEMHHLTLNGQILCQVRVRSTGLYHACTASAGYSLSSCSTASGLYVVWYVWSKPSASYFPFIFTLLPECFLSETKKRHPHELSANPCSLIAFIWGLVIVKFNRHWGVLY